MGTFRKREGRGGNGGGGGGGKRGDACRCTPPGAQWACASHPRRSAADERDRAASASTFRRQTEGATIKQPLAWHALCRLRPRFWCRRLTLMPHLSRRPQKELLPLATCHRGALRALFVLWCCAASFLAGRRWSAAPPVVAEQSEATWPPPPSATRRSWTRHMTRASGRWPSGRWTARSGWMRTSSRSSTRCCPRARACPCSRARTRRTSSGLPLPRASGSR